MRKLFLIIHQRKEKMENPINFYLRSDFCFISEKSNKENIYIVFLTNAPGSHIINILSIRYLKMSKDEKQQCEI